MVIRLNAGKEFLLIDGAQVEIRRVMTGYLSRLSKNTLRSRERLISGSNRSPDIQLKRTQNHNTNELS